MYNIFSRIFNREFLYAFDFWIFNKNQMHVIIKYRTCALAVSRPMTLAVNHASILRTVHTGLVTKPNAPVLMTMPFQVSE